MDNRVPPLRTIAGKPVCIRFAPVQLPYIQPGETRALVPIALEPFEGGWQAGGRYLHRLAQYLDADADAAGVVARSALLAAVAHQLPRGRASPAFHRVSRSGPNVREIWGESDSTGGLE